MDKQAILQTVQALLSHPWVLIAALLLGLYVALHYLKALFKVTALLVLFVCSVFLFIYGIQKGWIGKIRPSVIASEAKQSPTEIASVAPHVVRDNG